MPLDPKKILADLTALWAKLSTAKRAAAILFTLLTLGGISFATLRPTSTAGDAILFAGLMPEDAATVVNELKTNKVPYHLENGGGTIMVPEDRVHELRLEMASIGVPRGGAVGFEVFDKQAFGTTSFVEKLNYQRAISGELARSISTLSAVERARVHLAVPERSLYAKADEPPSASVVLKLRPGRELSHAQVQGIVHLVSSSIERLKPDAVTIVDEAGNALWSGEDLTDGKDDQRELERRLQKRVTDITERMVGPGRSVVSVTSELDHSYTERTEEQFDKDAAAVRSETKSEEESRTADKSVGGVAGVQGNLPGAPVSPAPAGAAESTASAGLTGPGHKKTSETRNFELGHVVSRTLGPKVQVRRLHVAILVDGIPEEPGIVGGLGNTSTSSLAATSSRALAKVKEVRRYRVRTQEELDRIAALAKEAAGLDPSRGDRIEVHSAPFFDQKTEEIEPPVAHGAWWEQVDQRWIYAAAGAAALVFGLLVLALWALVRKKPQPPVLALEDKKAMPLLPVTAAEAESALADAPAQSLEPAVDPNVDPLRDRAAEAAKLDPVKAAAILSAWLSEEIPETKGLEAPRLPQAEAPRAEVRGEAA
ncbi:MAG: flagellar basal-body MS-ring/collar protein FliF [Myxococcota bacterium]